MRPPDVGFSLRHRAGTASPSRTIGPSKEAVAADPTARQEEFSSALHPCTLKTQRMRRGAAAAFKSSDGEGASPWIRILR